VCRRRSLCQLVELPSPRRSHRWNQSNSSSDMSCHRMPRHSSTAWWRGRLPPTLDSKYGAFQGPQVCNSAEICGASQDQSGTDLRRILSRTVGR
jgi:hypothetical protein